MAEWIIEIKDGKFPIGKWTELVRCKDCLYYEAGYCTNGYQTTPRESHFYCGDAERKDSEENE